MLFILFLTYFLIYEVIFCNAECYIKLCDWIVSTTIHISWGFTFDTLSVLMLFVILSISTAVHVYSLEYMGEDPFIKRFISYLSLFTFFMIILVTGDNLLQMFVGWEGVGLCSYLLINYWSTRILANKAAMTAVIANRVGDIFLMNAIILLFSVYKTTEIELIALLVNF